MSFWNNFKQRIGISGSNGKIVLRDTKPVTGLNGDGPSTQRASQTLNAAGYQSTGRKRDSNDDSLFFVFGSTLGDNIHHDYGLFMVADGAGGHGHADVASAAAIEAASSYMIHHAFPKMLDPQSKSEEKFGGLMEKSMQAAQKAVIEKTGGGVTTLTSVLVIDRFLTIAHVGDCRVYLESKVGLELITRDHSYPWRMVESGEITAEEAFDHPDRNLLWNALGQDSEPVIDLIEQQIPAGGSLIICTDGLWTEVAEDTLHNIVRLNVDPSISSRELVRMAEVAGGSDNISSIVVRFSS